MAVKIQTPAEAKIPDVGQSYVPPGGVPLYVGGKDKHGNDWNWESVATACGMAALDLIRFNYKTTIPEVVNFYLERNCGCTAVTLDGKNYRFPGAKPGVIYMPAIPPLVRFLHTTVLPMEMRPHPTRRGRFEMAAYFTIDLKLNPKLPDPSLYEYRQEIRGSAFIREGAWSGETWTPTGASHQVPPTAFPVPGLPPGLQRFWKEDGIVDPVGDRFYGHRENGYYRLGAERDEYVGGPLTGDQYIGADRPGLEGDLVVGQRVSLSMDFIGSVVRFDKPPGEKGRRIVETVAKRHWSYDCARTVKFDSPLVPVP